MGNEFVSCSFLLLLFFMHGPGNAAGAHMEDVTGVTPNGVNVLRLPNMDFAEQKEDVKHVPEGNHGRSSSHMGMDMMGMGMDMAHLDPAANVFSVINDIQVGKTIPIYFPHIDDPDSFQFFPRERTGYIPFSSKALPELLRFFSFSPDSHQALAMEQTLSICEMETPEGEIKDCVTSSESLIDFARRVFGSDSQAEILRSSLITKSTPLLQNYTVLQSKEVTTGKIIPCHNEPYPYGVYYCHFQFGTVNKVFKVSLSGENGDRIDAVFLCHMDTSKWGADHIAFRVLGLKPGTSEVCHFFPAYDLVVVPK